MSIGIRPYSITDAEKLYPVVMNSSSHLRPWMPWLHSSYAIDDTAKWVNECVKAWENKSAFRYLIYDNETQKILGSAGLERIVWAHKIAELGYWVSSEAINKGIATAAVKLVVKKSFQTHEINRIEINILPSNIASNQVANKIGAVFEGEFRNKLFHNGKSNPANCYSLIPGDIKF